MQRFGNLRLLIRKTGELVLNLLYPQRCLLCDGTVWVMDEGVCPQCRNGIEYVGELRCMRCGKAISDAKEEYCSDCKRKSRYFDRGISLCVYKGKVKESIYRLKYKERQQYGMHYGRMIVKYLGDEIKALNADALIPVPLHRDREKKRGYNQAAIVANEIGRILKIPVCENIIGRSKNTNAMKLQTAQDRQKNIKNAFKILTNDVKLETAVLIDDIYTTGSTLDEMSRTLKNAGVKHIYFVTIATGKDYI